jgi:hypothetical protein
MRRIALFVGSVFVLVAMAEPALAQWRWGIGLNGGYETGGKLYRVKSDQAAPRWPRPDGSGTVDGTELRAEIDGFASFGVRATLEHPRGLGAILSASISDLDVSVIRRTLAENVDKVPWDQWFTIQVQAVANMDAAARGQLSLSARRLRADELRQRGRRARPVRAGAGGRRRIPRAPEPDVDARSGVPRHLRELSTSTTKRRGCPTSPRVSRRRAACRSSS